MDIGSILHAKQSILLEAAEALADDIPKPARRRRAGVS